jgi:hypothetical protein
MRGAVLSLAIGALAVTGAVHAQPRSIVWQVNAGGGGAMAGHTVRLDGTLSQLASGRLSASTGIISQGFWTGSFYGPYEKIVAGETASNAGLTAGSDAGPEKLRVTVLPNMTSGPATVTCWVPRDGTLRIELFDAWGIPVTSLYCGSVMSGLIDLKLDCGTLPSGTYYLRLQTEEETVARTVKVVR